MGDDQQPFDLTQYSPLGIQHYGAIYKNDPKALEKLSRRICARVEQDSSDLLTFCDKRIRKRQKKLEEEQLIRNHLQRQQQTKNYKKNKKQQQDPEEHSPPASAAPEVVSGSDLLLGACLGQG